MRGVRLPAATVVAAGIGLALAPRAGAQIPTWPGGALSRLEAFAVLQTLNSDLLSHTSATLTLDRWCAAHRLADPPHVVADRQAVADKPVTPELRELLGVDAAEPVRYRHVRLRCGAHVLSEADNWYVPGRLTPAMNEALDRTDIAFGRAVQALNFQRRTLSAVLTWQPLESGWDMAERLPDSAGGELAVPASVIEHRALLTLPDGTPFSLVIETYTGEVLAFRPPAP